MSGTLAVAEERRSSFVSFVRDHPSFCTGALVFLVLAPLAWRQYNSYDGVRMKIVALSIIDHGTPIVKQSGDTLGFNTPYSIYGIGMSLVMAPLYLIGKTLRIDGPRWMNLAGPLLFAVTCAVVVEILRRRKCSPQTIALTVAVVIVGSPLLAYAIGDFSEPGVACMVALMILALDGMARRARFAPLGAGAAVGGAILFRGDSLVLIAVPVGVAVLVLATDRVRDAAYFAAGVAPAIVIWGAYNAARFGSPLDSGYDQVFNHAFWSGAYGLLLSPGRGLLVYAPIVIVAIVLVPSMRGADRVIGFLAIALVATRVVFFARWWSWYGGAAWGPRFLMPVLPAFVPVIAVALQRRPGSRPVLAAGLAGLAMAVIGLFIAVFPHHNSYVPPAAAGVGRGLIRNQTTPEYVHRVDGIMFDWTRFPLRR